MREATQEEKNAISPELYRTEFEAVRCKHLNWTPLHRTTESLRPMPSVKPQSLLLPHENGGPAVTTKLTVVTLWPQFPSIAFMCTSPKVVDWARSIMPEQLHAQVNDIETDLSKCRCCLFYEERENQ